MDECLIFTLLVGATLSTGTLGGCNQNLFEGTVVQNRKCEIVDYRTLESQTSYFIFLRLI